MTVTLWTVSLFSCLIAGFLTAVMLRWRVEEDVQVQLSQSTSRLVVLGLSTLPSKSENQLFSVIIKNLLSVSRVDRIMRIFDHRGRLLYSSFPSEELGFLDTALKEHLESVALDDHEHKPIVVSNDLFAYVSVIQAYRNSNGEKRLIQAAQSIPRFRETLKESGAQYALVFLIMLVFSLGASIFLSLRLTRPIRKVAEHLKQLDHQDVRSWRPIPESDDRAFLALIIKNANNLIGRVQNAFFVNHNLARFVAHEVRTPLTMMLGEIELAKRLSPDSERVREMIETFSKDILKMDRIISTILEIAQRDRSSNPYHPRPVEILPFVQKLSQDFRETYRRFLQVTVEGDVPIEVNLDPDLLLLMLDNLLRNSVKHGAINQKHEIKIFRDDPRTIVLQILDSGPGLDEDVAAALNRREIPGKRIGLGLSLALEISKISSWRLKFHNTHPGLCVSISIPMVGSILTSEEGAILDKATMS